ncbi:MAG: CHAT domain-containing protein, partial [Bacteroidota bacterium]|nr:CHAT domain-containing protein [Bacteroidota bacterium]
SIAWYIENNIETIYTRKGEYDKAEYFSNLTEISLKYYNLLEFLSRHITNKGTFLYSQIKIDEALRTFQQGFHLADSINYSNGIFANAVNLAEIYNDIPVMDSVRKYLAISESKLTELKTNTRYLEKKSDFEFETANYYAGIGDYKSSIIFYWKAIRSLEEYYTNTNRREFAHYYASLASVYSKLDSLPVAIRMIDKGLTSLIPDYADQSFPQEYQLYPENKFIELLEIKSAIYRKLWNQTGNLELLHLAMGCLDKALTVNDMIREYVIADPSKLLAIRNNKNLVSQGIQLMYELYQRDPSTELWDKARSYFNKSKSLLYSEKVRKHSLSSLISEVDRNRCAQLYKQINEFIDKKYIDGANVNDINGLILTCQEELNAIYSKYKNVLLHSNHPNNYIEYFVSDSSVFSLSELEGIKKFELNGSASELNLLTERLRTYILSKGYSQDNSILSDGFRFLISPVSDTIPSKIVIIPDETIGYIPFEMLLSPDGHYLIENTTISYAFEYQTFDNPSNSTENNFEVYCLAPKYDEKSSPSEDINRGSIKDLPYAKIEVDSIQALFGDASITSYSNQKSDWKLNINSASIFHYAGHAIISETDAYLALLDTTDLTMQLTTADIGRLQYPLELVVLSACETGLGKLENGEGIRSLGRSFMESGVQSTIISLWNVNDKSTALIMLSFYDYLLKGLTKDEALRKAKLDYIEQASSRGAHPYFWAAFIPAGDMKSFP